MENPDKYNLADLPSQGYYRRFKGNYYQLLGIANHSETLEPMVIYLALYGERKLWVRPASMWNEIIEREDYRGHRFIPVDVDDVLYFYNELDPKPTRLFWRNLLRRKMAYRSNIRL